MTDSKLVALTYELEVEVHGIAGIRQEPTKIMQDLKTKATSKAKKSTVIMDSAMEEHIVDSFDSCCCKDSFELSSQETENSSIVPTVVGSVGVLGEQEKDLNASRADI